MSDLEYDGKMNPKPLISPEEELRRERAKFQKDELDRALRRSGKLVTPEPETTYERLEQ